MAAVESAEAERRRNGWYLSATSIEPPKLFGGDRQLVIPGVGISVLLGTLVAARANVSIGPFSGWSMCIIFSVLLYLGWTAMVRLLWLHDPWMRRTYPRYLRHPKFLAAHPTGAASLKQRRKLHAQGFKR